MNDKTHVANCVMTDEFGRILLMHRASDDVSGWELPAATVRDDESPETVAIRTIYDEFATAVQAARTLGSGEYELDGIEYICHWFQLTVKNKISTDQYAEGFDDADYFELDDLLSLSLSPDVQLLLEKIMEGEVVLQAA